MRVRLEATRDELLHKSAELVEHLADRLEDDAPELADALRKAAPRREPELKFRVLRDLHELTADAYRRQLDRMLADVGKVLDRTTSAASVHKSLRKQEGEEEEEKPEPGDIDVETGELIPTEEEKEEEREEREEEKELEKSEIVEESGIDWIDDGLDEVMKAAGHKYLRRWRGADGKWRYEYRKLATATLRYYDVGDKVSVKHRGQEGHFEVLKVREKDGKRQLFVRHDETGKETWISEVVLAELFRQTHNVAAAAANVMRHADAVLSGYDPVQGPAVTRDKPKAHYAKQLEKKRERLKRLFDPYNHYHSLMDYGAKAELFGYYKTELHEIAEQVKPMLSALKAELEADPSLSSWDIPGRYQKEYRESHEKLFRPLFHLVDTLNYEMSWRHSEQKGDRKHEDEEVSDAKQAAFEAAEKLEAPGRLMHEAFMGLFSGKIEPDKWLKTTKGKITRYFNLVQQASAANTTASTAEKKHRDRRRGGDNPITEIVAGRNARYVLQLKHASEEQKAHVAQHIEGLDLSIDKMKAVGLEAAAKDLVVHVDYRPARERGSIFVEGHGSVKPAGTFHPYSRYRPEPEETRDVFDTAGKGGVTIFSTGMRESLPSGTMIHELGHRYYYRNLTDGERAEWQEEIEKRTMTPTKQEVDDLWAKVLPVLADAGEPHQPDQPMPETDRRWVDLDVVHGELAKHGKLGKAASDLLRSTYIDGRIPIGDISSVVEQLEDHPVVEPFVSFYGGTNASEYFAEVMKYYVGGGPRNVPPWARALFEKVIARERVRKSLDEDELYEDLAKALAGPYVGPRGGLWADPARTIPYKKKAGEKARAMPKLTVGPLDEDAVAAQVERLALYPQANLEEFLARVESYARRLGDKAPKSLDRWRSAVLQALGRRADEPPEPGIAANATTGQDGGLSSDEVHTGDKPTTEETEPSEEPVTVQGGEPYPPGFKIPPKPEVEPKPKKRKPAKRKPKKRKPAIKKPELEPGPPEEMVEQKEKIGQVGEHIWGSRKDLAEVGMIESSAQLEGMSFDDAARIVTKNHLVPVHDLQTLRGLGMTPGAAHMTLAVLAAIRAKPQDTALARAAYVDRVHEVLGSLKHCKTVDDVNEMLREMRQTQFRAPKWEEVARCEMTRTALDAKVKELEKDNPKVKFGYRADYSRNKYTIVKKASKPYDALGANFVNFINVKKVYQEAFQEAMTVDGLWQVAGTEKPKTAEEGWKYLEERGRAKNEERKEKAKEAAKKRKKGFTWAEQVAEEAERHGHTVDVEDADPQRVLDTFGLKEIDFGQKGYMSQADREYHVTQLEGALHDFSEILGVDPKLLSLGGRIGIAMGARGRGKAKAHYEVMGKAINITKFRGNGSLAHEWGHALDNIIAEHQDDGDGRTTGSWLTERPSSSKWPPAIRDAVVAVVSAMDKHPDPEKAKKDHQAHLAKLRSEERDLVRRNNELVGEAKKIQSKIAAEHAEKHVARLEKRVVEYDQEIAELEAKQAKKPLGQSAFVRLHHLKGWKKQSLKAIDETRTGAGIRTEADDRRLDEIKEKIEDLRLPINRTRKELNELKRVDPTRSTFARDAHMMGSYWRQPIEKFARCFAAFVQDELEDNGRRNSYLVDGTRIKYEIQKTFGGPFVEPFPHGEERKAVNRAIRDLLEVLKSTGDLEKALLELADLMKAEDTEEPVYDYTKPLYDADERAYDRIKAALIRHGYELRDFEKDGPLSGQSVNQLVELLRGLEGKKPAGD